MKLFPFVVDPDTLTLQLKPQSDPLGEASLMSMNQLQNFANHCDDIVFGKSIEETMDRLMIVFGRLRSANLKF